MLLNNLRFHSTLPTLSNLSNINSQIKNELQSIQKEFVENLPRAYYGDYTRDAFEEYIRLNGQAPSPAYIEADYLGNPYFKNTDSVWKIPTISVIIGKTADKKNYTAWIENIKWQFGGYDYISLDAPLGKYHSGFSSDDLYVKDQNGQHWRILYGSKRKVNDQNLIAGRSQWQNIDVYHTKWLSYVKTDEGEEKPNTISEAIVGTIIGAGNIIVDTQATIVGAGKQIVEVAKPIEEFKDVLVESVPVITTAVKPSYIPISVVTGKPINPISVITDVPKIVGEVIKDPKDAIDEVVETIPSVIPRIVDEIPIINQLPNPFDNPIVNSLSGNLDNLLLIGGLAGLIFVLSK